MTAIQKEKLVVVHKMESEGRICPIDGFIVFIFCKLKKSHYICTIKEK